MCINVHLLVMIYEFSVFPQRVRVCLSHLWLLLSLQHFGGVWAPLQLPSQKRVLLLPPFPPDCPAPGHPHSGVARRTFHHPRSETRHGKSQKKNKNPPELMSWSHRVFCVFVCLLPKLFVLQRDISRWFLKLFSWLALHIISVPVPCGGLRTKVQH